MRVIASIALAFGMYTRVPLALVAWDAPNMRYVLGALPLVGLVQGALSFGVGAAALALGFPPVLCALLLVMTPIIFNGGIHLDGLCDTSDALASHATPEEKLRILKDPNAGAFGVLALVCYVVSIFALFASFPLSLQGLGAVGCLYVLSRAVGAWTVLRWPNANAAGTANGFKAESSVRATSLVLGVAMVAAGGALVVLAGVSGAIALGALLGCLLWFNRRVMSLFGGMTGDLAGWLVQILELVMLAAVVGGGWVL